MIALKIAEVKDFMNKLLCQDVFDHFLIQEAVITTNVSCHIDGTLQKDFYTLEELEEQNLTGLSFVPYGLLRSFKFSLLLSPENLKRTLSQTGSSFTENDISAVFLNIRFQNGELTVTTGISYRIFSTDKTLEHEWDTLLKRFLTKNQISFDEL